MDTLEMLDAAAVVSAHSVGLNKEEGLDFDLDNFLSEVDKWDNILEKVVKNAYVFFEPKCGKWKVSTIVGDKRLSLGFVKAGPEEYHDGDSVTVGLKVADGAKYNRVTTASGEFWEFAPGCARVRILRVN